MGIFNYCSDISIDKHLYMLWSFQLSTAALCLLLPCFSVCECPFKALHHPLCSFFFFSLSTFLSVQPFLPRDNWLIHQCITPPPPDPQCHGCLRSSRHTFQGHVQFVMTLDIMHHTSPIRSQCITAMTSVFIITWHSSQIFFGIKKTDASALCSSLIHSELTGCFQCGAAVCVECAVVPSSGRK